MENKLRRHVDGLFAETAPTKRAVELKEEMIQNLQDKYRDLIEEGKTPESACNIAIAGIGDVSGLLHDLEEPEPEPPLSLEAYELARRKSALLTAAAVMLYILSFLPMLVLEMYGVWNAERYGMPVMFIMVAIATGLLVYNGMTKPRRAAQPDTMVEEFRQWQQQSQDGKALRRAISGALWPVILVLYFVLSFVTRAWYITWVIFLVGAAIEAVINVFYTLKK